MKYLVVSDNHGDRDCLVDLADYYRGKVDCMFHCGDSELEPTDSLWDDFVVVTGNCDYDERFLKEQLVKTDEDRILMTHGHLYNVRQTLSNLVYRAQELSASIVLFGHTHELGVEMIEEVLVLNPGSISLPRGQYMIKTYAIIENLADSYQVSYYRDNHEKLSHLTVSFTK